MARHKSFFYRHFFAILILLSLAWVLWAQSGGSSGSSGNGGGIYIEKSGCDVVDDACGLDEPSTAELMRRQQEAQAKAVEKAQADFQKHNMDQILDSLSKQITA